MRNGKIRNLTHIIDEEALRFLNTIFPVEWVQRSMTPDYGIDIDLEIFDYENNCCITQGEHVFLQVKGTRSAKYSTYEVYENDDNTLNSKCKIETLAFSIDTPLLNLVRKMGTALPVLLVVVDLSNSNAFFVCLNDYIDKVLDLRNPNFVNQETVTIHIPLDNQFSKDNLDMIRMYAKRAKLCALFNQLNSYAVNYTYLDPYLYEKNISKTLKFLSSIITSHAWSAKSFLCMIEDTYQDIDFLLKNHGLDKFSVKQLNKFCLEGKNPYTEIWYYGISDIPMPYLCTLQMKSINQLISNLNNLICIYEDDIRPFFLPTYWFLIRIDKWNSAN